MEEYSDFERQLDKERKTYNARVFERIIAPFHVLTQRNPEEGLSYFSDVVNLALDLNKNKTRAIYPVSITSRLLNILGEFYPKLPNNRKEQALKKAFSLFERIPEIMISSNLERMEGGQFISDIMINTNYRINAEGYKKNLKDLSTIEKFKERFLTKVSSTTHRLNVHSLFWLGYFLGNKEYAPCADEVREMFNRAFEDQVDEIQDAVASFIFDEVNRELPKRRGKLKEKIEDKLETYDPTWHAPTRRKIAEAKWIWLPEREKIRVKGNSYNG